jgi:translocation and assembly module TamA
LLLAATLLAPGDSRAAPQDGEPHAPDAFALQISAPSGAIRELLERHLDLQRFRKLPDLQDGELERLISAADADARGLLATLGYFNPAIAIELRENPAPAKGASARTVHVTVTPGQRTRIAGVHITLDGAAENPALARRQTRIERGFGLQPGAPFTQQGWDEAKAQGLRALQTRRYPTARIESSRASVDADSARADLSVRYAPGPPYRFGALTVQGSTRYDSEGARRIARLPTGAEYSETSLLDAQQRLAASGYYDSVFLTLDTDAADPQNAPVTAQVRDAPLQKLVFGVGFSTDSGARLSMDHIHNRLPWLGWRAVSKISLDAKNKLASTEWTGLPLDDGWRWFTGAQLQRQDTGSYEVNSTRLRVGQTKGSEHIDRSYYLQHDTADSQGTDAPPLSSALSANYSWTGRYFDSNTLPTHGWGLGTELGAGTTLRPRRDPFTRALLRWQAFLSTGRVDMGGNISRGSRLALRLEGGAVLARPGADIPVTQLFLTGGDTTVRGYGYRQIGARLSGGQIFGGRYMALGSVEWQRPIELRGNRTDFESALFIDTGAVADTIGAMQARTGVGAGLRWRSPVGPLQMDVAYGLHTHQVRLHLRLGYFV